ncbi:hypothetical protein HW555_005994 [Spodoptera exigua]|uniref:Uncharacterized protein n=1 Tax=Spodoptera exigua TaxID=7107 RepID=A0A835GIP7_SPOEX|nr:hypothetical protein HW555_005994 [Spodoptera exigua]
MEIDDGRFCPPKSKNLVPSPVDSGDRLPTEEPCAFGYLDSKGFSSSKVVTLCLPPSGALMKIAPSWVQHDRIPKC